MTVPMVELTGSPSGLANSSEFCQWISSSHNWVSRHELLTASRGGRLGPIGDARKHILGAWMLSVDLRMGADMVSAVHDLYDINASEYPSPGELHGGVWQALLLRVNSSVGSMHVFRQVATRLCPDSSKFAYYHECFHGVGHGAFLSIVVQRYIPLYAKTQCPQLGIQSVPAEAFNLAHAICMNASLWLISGRFACVTGTIHVGSTHVKAFKIHCREQVIDPWQCPGIGLHGSVSEILSDDFTLAAIDQVSNAAFNPLMSSIRGYQQVTNLSWCLQFGALFSERWKACAIVHLCEQRLLDIKFSYTHFDHRECECYYFSFRNTMSEVLELRKTVSATEAAVRGIFQPCWRHQNWWETH